MTRKILVTCRIPEEGLKLLEERFGPPIVNPWGRRPAELDLAEAAPGVEGMLTMLSDPVTRRVLLAADRCRVVSNYAAGYDNIDVAAASGQGIAVTNTPGVLTETTADLAFALILGAARRICEGDRLTRSGRFSGWDPMLLCGRDVHGKTLGIIGAGRIGRAVGRRAAGFAMPIIYHGRRRSPEFERECGARYAGLADLLKDSDFVSIHVPCDATTHHMLGAREFAVMKPTAVLVNTARGAVIDEAALVEALSSGKMFAAGLDVYEDEPALHPGLAGLDNVVLLPHAGSASVETRRRMARMAAQNLIAVLEGRRPEQVVNPEVLR